MRERAPFARRLWRRPVYVMFALMGAIVLVATPAVLQNSFKRSDVLGVLLQLAPFFAMFGWWVAPSIKTARLVKNVRRAHPVEPGYVARYFGLGLRGAYELGTCSGRPIFMNEYGRGILVATKQGLEFWDAELVELGHSMAWSEVTEVRPARVDTTIWKGHGVEIIGRAGDGEEQRCAVSLELRSQAFFGLFPCSVRSAERFAAELSERLERSR